MSSTYRKPIDLNEKQKMLLKQLQKKEAAAILAQQRKTSADARCVVLPRTDRASYPLSLSQEQLWRREQIEPAKPLMAVISFKEEVQPELLQKSLQTLVERHEILRAIFLKQHDQPVQLILSDTPVILSIGAAETSQTLTELLRAHQPPKFDVAHGPLFQASLLRLNRYEQIFLLSMHPLLADRYSLDLCCQELITLYQDALTGQNTPLPTSSLNYADYANWQQQYLQGTILKEQLSYWKQQLTGATLTLNLPYDHARTSLALIQPDHTTLELKSTLTQAANAFCKQNDLPLDHLLFTICSLLLHRYTSQIDIVCGFLDPHRTPELTTVIGNFATQLPIRVHLSEDLTAHEIVQQVHNTINMALQHAELPLEQIVEAVDPQHDLTRIPFFQTSFAFHQHPALANVSTHLCSPLPEPFLQDLAFVFHYNDQQLSLSVAYNGALFSQASIERLQTHYSQLLQSFLQQPQQTFSELPCLTQDEQETILYTWNAAHLAEPLARTEGIHQLFERQVQRTPQAIALSDGQQQLTYQQLNHRANQLAHLLRQRGVEPEQLVGLCHSRSLDLIVGVFAILKAGAAYLPLDPTYPRDRLAFTIQDAQPVLILTQQDLLERMPFSPEQALCLDTPGIFDQESTKNLNVDMHNEQLAYIIYTSGSTGRPKGVCISHRSAQAFLYWSRQQFSDEELSGVLCGTSICFDLSIFEIFAPLSWGGKTILAASVLDLPHLARHEHITLLNTVPSAATALLNAHDLPTSLRTINLAGEALTRDLVQALYAQTSIQRVCNLYGPTEDTTYSTEMTLHPEEEGSVSIGRPLANTQAYILDAQMQPVPIGIIGELYLGGDGQAHGYLNHPKLTAERFVSDPFSHISGRRLYKTGDLVRYRPDGNIDYLGRIDHQVKIRGFRIELGEIEAQLRLHPAISDVVVVAIEEVPGHKQLVAYIVTQPHMDYEIAQIRQYLQDLLPVYMVPTFFIPLERMPQTLNGKVDRKALPGPRDARFRLSLAPNTLPQGKQEQWLAQLWQEILLVPMIGRTDNFFSLGGNSLHAFRLLARIRRDFQQALTVEDLFANPTIAQLADKLQGIPVRTDLKPITMVNDPVISPDTPLPLSFAQQRIWFDDQLEHENAMFNIPLVFTLSGSLDRLALYQAIREIIRRHAPLRTTIRTSKGNPFQFINDHITLSFTSIHLSNLAETGKNQPEEIADVLHEIQQEVQRPFDIASGPLLRVRLLHLPANQHVLLLTMHHIITDGWSLSVITKELGLLYNAFRHGRPSPLPELPIRFIDFVTWQRVHQAPHFAADLAYWKANFTPLPPTLDLLTDYPRPLLQTFAGSALHFQFSQKLTRQLLKVSQEEKVTLFITLLTAFFVLLARYSGQEDLVVGTSVANRLHPELETLVGFFVNDLALRADVSGNPTLNQLLHRVATLALDAYCHHEVPFEQVVEAAQPPRDPRRSPLRQVHFLLQNTPEATLDLDDLQVRSIDITPPASQFDLAFVMREHDDGLQLSIEYKTKLFTAATIERLQRHYHMILCALVEQAETPIQEISLLTDEERKRLVQSWQQTSSHAPTTQLLHELFAEQAARTPNAIALQEGTKKLTYQELNQQANQIAHSLQRRGVGPEILVGLCLERSLEQMIGLLAILKAGGAYVPLDPQLSPERLDDVVTETQLTLVLTKQEYATLLQGKDRELLYLDGTERWWKEESKIAAANKESPQQLACVIYTAGSLGRPKGVLLTHQNVVNHSSAIAHHYQFSARDRVLQFHSLSVDTAMEEIFPTWFTGATLILHPTSVLSTEQFHSYLETYGVSIVDLPTAYWYKWIYEMDRCPRPFPIHLRLVIIGGEKIDIDRWRQWQGLVDNRVESGNTYGSVETTITATLCDVSSSLAAQELISELAIGKPLPNVRAYILDNLQQPVPPGLRGELYLAGEGITRGYLGLPGLTAERFVPDPLSDEAGQRMYRTGDRVYQQGDGQLVYVDRLDQQVRRHNLHLEPGEIEQILRSQPSIQQAAVLLSEGQKGSSQCIAYVQPQVNCTLDVALLRLALKKQLPAAMVPTAIVAIKAFPLTPSGKIDRQKLGSLDQHRLAGNISDNVPQGPIEEFLAHIWKKILKLLALERNDNFFEMGGHSLLAMQMLAALQEELHVTISIRQFFTAPTITELARIIEQEQAKQQSETQMTVIPALVPIAHADEYPLSFAQQRLWFLDQLEGSSATYNIPIILHLTGNLRLDVLQQCMNEIMRRHEVLRTTFPKKYSTPSQHIHLLAQATLEIIDFPDGELPDKQELLLEEISSLVQHPFDLTQGPLLRTHVLRLSQSKHIVIFVMHHIISDGWSIGILAQELNALYNAFLVGKPSPLPELAIQYVDFVAWQREYLQGPLLAAHLDYWKQKLCNAPILQLPADYPRVVTQSLPGANCSTQWPLSLARQLQVFSQQEGVTIFMTLLAGFLILLAQESKQEDLTVGSPIANRSHTALEPLVGFFVNTLALRTNLTGNLTGREILHRVRDVTLEAYDHQDVPFEQIVEAVHPIRLPGVSPLFQVLFVLQNNTTVDLALPNLEVKGLDMHTSTAKFDLTVALEIKKECMHMNIEYNAQLFERTTIQRIQTHYRLILNQLSEHPEYTRADFAQLLSDSITQESTGEL